MRPGLPAFAFCALTAAILCSGCMTRRVPNQDACLPPPLSSVAPEAPLPGLLAPADQPAVEVPGFTTNVTDRLMIYDATITLVVPDITGALDKVRALAAGFKGYMQQMGENSITLRIPAARLNEAIAAAEKMGTVVSRQIEGTDVTDEMRDFDIRLKNEEQMRQRLTTLLEKGDKVEDLLKIEKELERVTESIELIKGKIQFMQNAIAYSTLTVKLNSPVALQELEEVIPFAWVRNLATDVTGISGRNFRPEWHFFSWMTFDLPAGYVLLHEGASSTYAMSGDGVVLLVSRHENFKNGSLDFWSKTIRRSLAASKLIAVTSEKPITLASGIEGTLLSGTKTVARIEHKYLLAVVTNEDYIYTFECWGPAGIVTRDSGILEQSIKSIPVKK